MKFNESFLIMLVGIMFLIVIYFLDNINHTVPVVYMSVSQQKCTKIIKYDKILDSYIETNCEGFGTMEKYHIIYTK